MINITANQIEEEWLTAVAEPGVDEIERLNVREMASIKGILGGDNKIWLGKPQIFDLRNYELGKDEQFLTSRLETHDIYIVQVACSFRPASSCRFMHATVQLCIRSEESASSPIVLDMQPLEVVMPITYKRSFSINPQIEFSLEKVAQVKASAFTLENAKEYLVYQPEITAFGKGTDEVGWDFNKTTSREIKGVKDLFLLIQTAKNQPTKMHLTISDCKVQTKIGSMALSSILLAGKTGELLEVEYSLTSNS